VGSLGGKGSEGGSEVHSSAKQKSSRLFRATAMRGKHRVLTVQLGHVSFRTCWGFFAGGKRVKIEAGGNVQTVLLMRG
jgi:hypothetical protein